MATDRQLSFSSGEIGPSLYGRADLVKYETGLRTCRNMLVQRHGGITNRAGTQFIAEVKDSTKKVVLKSFIFNQSQTYALEFGDQYIRFIKDGVQVTVSGVAAWLTATPYVIGALVVELGVNYYCIQAHTSSGANQPPNAAFWHQLTGSIYEIPTPYLEADLPTLSTVQSADVITIAHPTYEPRDLSRTADTNWILSEIVFGPTIAAPDNPAVAGTAGSESFTYHITSVASVDNEESLAAIVTQGSLTAPSANDHTITWDAVPAAQFFNIYLVENGVAGFIGTAVGTQFVNDGIIPKLTDNPPVLNNPFSGVGNFPSTVGYYQQRLMFANSNNDPERVWASQTNRRKNFNVSTPLQDDDSVQFDLVGQQVNEVRHMSVLGTLVIFTTGGEWAILGDAAGRLLPNEVNSKQHSYNGSSERPAITVDGNALYVQARGSIIRDLGFEFNVDGYRGNDLTIFAAHLFDKFTLDDWAFQQIPHSVVWAVRSDGVMLGLTYVLNHQIVGWHQHDTDGKFENVLVVPETVGISNEDVLYVVVNRTINGVTRRYIERFATRKVDEDAIEDSIFMDSSLSFDGTNTTPTTMTLSGGITWTAGEDIIITASAAEFLAGDVGNEIHLTVGSVTLKVELVGFTSTTVMDARALKDVPVAFREVAILTWAKAVDVFGGLSHLEGKDVSAFGDGFVAASPNNDTFDTAVTVTAGVATFDRPYARMHIGLPYLSDAFTLDVDTATGEPMADKVKLIQRVTVFFEESRGFFAGREPPPDEVNAPLFGLNELKVRQDEDMDDPVALLTGTEDVKIEGKWNRNGRVFMRQVDPVPLTILTLIGAGYIPKG